MGARVEPHHGDHRGNAHGAAPVALPGEHLSRRGHQVPLSLNLAANIS